MSDGHPLITRVIQRYFPDWEPPKDTGREWIKVTCPWHGDGVASAGISFRYNAFRCLGCGLGGSAVRIIKEQEEVTFAEAKRVAEEVSEGSDGAVPRESPRIARRRLFADEGFVPRQPQGRSVSTGVRRRTFGGA